MQKYNPGYAQHIKAQLADFLLEKFNSENICIASEVPVERKTSIIDMMLISENKIIGFEVKSDFDSRARLSKQMESYHGAFNAIYLVCGANYSQKVGCGVRQCVGVLSAETGGIKLVRKASYRHYPEKRKMVNFLWKKDIPYPFFKPEIGVEKLRETVVKHMSKDKLFELVIQSLTNRYRDRFRAFMKGRGSVTCVQDIDILTIQNHYVY